MATKDELRRAWRAGYPRDAGVRRVMSARLVAELLTSDAFREANRVGIFYPLDWEPDLLPLWRARPEACAFPRVRRDPPGLELFTVPSLGALKPGYSGIPEPPADAARGPVVWGVEDLILVPGVAFDRAGGRIGSGRGFYDRFLAGRPSRKIGICFSAQVAKEKLAQEATDVRMDALCTEAGLEWISPVGK